MTRMMRFNVLAILVAVVVGGLLVGIDQTEASANSVGWSGPYSDGCAYYFDGYSYTLAFCPSTAYAYSKGYDLYAMVNGQWTYAQFTAGPMVDGGKWAWIQGQYYTWDAWGNLTSPTEPPYNPLTSVGGYFHGDQGASDVNGGANTVGPWLDPICYEHDGDVCRYYSS